MADVMVSYLALVALIFCTVIGAKLLFKRGSLDMPSPKPASWMHGHVPQITNSAPFKVWHKWAQQLGGIYYIRLVNQIMLVPTDAAIVQYLLTWEGSSRKALSFYDSMFVVGPREHSILADPHTARIKAIRPAMLRAFSPARMREAFPCVTVLTEQLVANLATKEVPASFDVEEELAGWALAVAAEVVLDLRNMLSAKHLPMLEALFQEASLRGLNPLRKVLHTLAPWQPDARRAAKYGKEMRAVFDGMAKDALSGQQEVFKEGRQGTALQQLVGVVVPPTNRAVTFEEVQANISLLALAGFETTMHSLAWALLALAERSDLQGRVEQELHGLGLLADTGRPARPLTYGDLSRLPVIDAVINETLRLFPVGLSVRDVQPAGGRLPVPGFPYKLPGGATVALVSYAIHRSALNWERPDELDIDRWIGKPDAHRRPSDGARRFYPFSYGSRDCVGQALAMMELRAALAMMVGRLRWRLAPEMEAAGGLAAAEASMVLGITVKCGMPIRLCVQDRLATTPPARAA